MSPRKRSNPRPAVKPVRKPVTKPFLEHLEELRRRLLWSLASILPGAVTGYHFSEPIISLCARSAGNLVFIKPYEAFMLKLKIAAFAGVLLALPVLFYHLWTFVTEAFSAREKRAVAAYLPVSLALFLGGAVFAYWIVVPFSMRFFLGQATPVLTPMLSANDYFSFLIWMVLVFGMVFEMPLAVLFLTRAGIVTPEMLRERRKVIVVGLFIAAALLTPPDVASQILLVIPLWVLFEISVWVAGAFRIDRK